MRRMLVFSGQILFGKDMIFRQKNHEIARLFLRGFPGLAPR